KKFNQRNFLPCGLAAVLFNLLSRLQNQKACGADFRPTIRDPFLNHLTAAERRPRRDMSRGSSLAHQLKGALANADPPHAVMDTARPKPLLSDGKAFGLFAEQA